MNIQEEVQKIHTHFGISEMGNYRIQLLFDKYNLELINRVNVLEETIENMNAIAGEKIQPVSSITSVDYVGSYDTRGAAGKLNQRQLEIIKVNNEIMDEMFGLNKELENNTTEIVSKHKGYYSATVHSCKKCNTEILRTSYNFCPNCGKKIVNK